MIGDESILEFFLFCFFVAAKAAEKLFSLLNKFLDYFIRVIIQLGFFWRHIFSNTPAEKAFIRAPKNSRGDLGALVALDAVKFFLVADILVSEGFFGPMADLDSAVAAGKAVLLDFQALFCFGMDHKKRDGERFINVF